MSSEGTIVENCQSEKKWVSNPESKRCVITTHHRGLGIACRAESPHHCVWNSSSNPWG